MKHLITLAFCLSASVASAQSCTGEDLVIIPEMEAAKDAFFDGNYQRFADMMGANFPGFSARAPEMFGPLENLVAGAYASCHTILQRHESPGFYQDMVIFYDDQVEGPISLLLVGADFGGEFRFVEFTFNSSMSAVLENLR